MLSTAILSCCYSQVAVALKYSGIDRGWWNVCLHPFHGLDDKLVDCGNCLWLLVETADESVVMCQLWVLFQDVPWRPPLLQRRG
jgi:hypothetical protein